MGIPYGDFQMHFVIPAQPSPATISVELLQLLTPMAIQVVVEFSNGGGEDGYEIRKVFA